MTVKELIEKLNRIPHNDQDAQVYFADLYIGDYGMGDCEHAPVENITYEPLEGVRLGTSEHWIARLEFGSSFVVQNGDMKYRVLLQTLPAAKIGLRSASSGGARIDGQDQK